MQHDGARFLGGAGAPGGVEALLRWVHPTRSSIPPDVFIPIAERFGLIGEIGNWVIEDLESSGDARAIVDAVVRLAHALGLRVVAEGVEAAGQRDVLAALGCDELQGYYFARPMPADTLLSWTEGNKPADTVDFAPSIVAEWS